MDTTLEDKTRELMEESRMLLVELSIDKVSLGVHSMGKAYLMQVYKCVTCSSCFSKILFILNSVTLLMVVIVTVVAGDFFIIN